MRMMTVRRILLGMRNFFSLLHLWACCEWICLCVCILFSHKALVRWKYYLWEVTPTSCWTSSHSATSAWEQQQLSVSTFCLRELFSTANGHFVFFQVSAARWCLQKCLQMHMVASRGLRWSTAQTGSIFNTNAFYFNWFAISNNSCGI